ncbi:hypothetical protein Ahy_B06g079902 isoform B [Arachis hypogaea]|nr:hypothetical protein Ahy_B06g079902 isoform B [Arachis hypogaea]
MQLPLGLNCLPCSLKVLHWEGSPLKALPFSNQLNELVDLNLSHSKIEQLWHGKKGLSIPKARFDMLITGSEIPSWFVPQRCISFAKIAIPQNCPVNDWVGFALCFMLVSYADPPQVCNHEVECYLFGPKGKMFINSRNLPLMEPYCPHLYILYLSIDKFRHTIYEGGHFKEIEFVLKSYCCHSLQIVRCGSRLVCKQDVEDIFGNHS